MMMTVDSDARSVREMYRFTTYKHIKPEQDGPFLRFKEDDRTSYFVKARSFRGVCHAIVLAIIGKYRYYLRYNREWYLRLKG